MLGDRRKNSLFASGAASPALEAKPEQAEVHNISFSALSDPHQAH